jgi:hypothetical protein
MPTSYTEQELAAFMVRSLGEVAVSLGWAAESPEVVEAVWDALHLYGAETVADATNVPALRALARVAIWNAVVDSTAARHAVSVEGMTFNREQVNAQARAALARAETRAASLGVGPLALVVSRVQHTDDPYAWLPDELRAV